MKKIILLPALLLLLLINYSCQKSDEIVDISKQNSKTKENFDMDLYQKYKSNFTDDSIKEDYSVIDGIVHFKNQESFRNVTSNLIVLKKDLETKGFISSEKYLKNLFYNMSKSKSKDEMKSIIESNDDYLTYNEDRVEIVDGMKIAPFTDKNGMFFVGKVLFMLSKNNQYIIYDGSLDKANEIINGSIKENNLVQKLSMNNNSKTKIQCNSLFSFVPSGNLACIAYVGGGFLIIPVGNDEFYTSGYGFTVGYTIDFSNGGFSFVTASNELKVNYKAKIVIFGTEVRSTEPNNTISNYDSIIIDWNSFGNRTVTQQEIDNTNGNIFILFEERSGYYKNLDLGLQANMNCN